MANAEFVPLELSQGEPYHVFCSYSSTDYQWTHPLIQHLEDMGLRVCDENNFTPGRPILENMSESIQQSQKVLLILSAEFVRSHWCLLEANMSMFRDCLQRKPIVPVLLQRDLPIPLHLAHLTYLDVHQPDFKQQLLKVLCTPNQDLQSSTVVPYQPPSLYNGKRLEPLSAVNQEQLNKEFDCGVWSDSVPDQLSLIIQQRERYREAIGIINTVAQTKVRLGSLWKQLLAGLAAIIVLASYYLVISLFINLPFWDNAPKGLQTATTVFLFLTAIWMIYKMCALIKNEKRRIVRALQKAIGLANSLLFEEHVLMGSQGNYKLLLVYVSVEDCRQELCAQYQDQEFFHKAILEYSCEYTRCLAKELLPFETTSTSGHLEGGVCFCQYVINQMLMGQTRRLCCCRVQQFAV
ncbi:uncharacterized protein [Eucyclogobius newberryi]|uniref:uncharacterized protein n=1 Tax=Eucyclogobius newberryi TaxID=166745 RepID=UPI003B5C2375